MELRKNTMKDKNGEEEKKNWKSPRTERTTINEILYTTISTDETKREKKEEERKRIFLGGGVGGGVVNI